MNKYKLQRAANASWKYAILIALMFITLVPFLMIVSVSFTDQQAINKFGYSLIPAKFSVLGWSYVLASPKQIIDAYVLTIAVTVVGTIGSVMIGALMAYPLSRPDFLYRKFVQWFLYIPGVISGGIVPTYILITQYLHLADTFWVLVVPTLAQMGYMWLLRTFFYNVPEALIESAKIEGAGEITIFLKIVLPVAKTGIATIALFTTLIYWNEWYHAMMYMNTDKYVTLQFFLQRIMENIQFLQREANLGTDVGMLKKLVATPSDAIKMASVLLAAGPMLCIFPFFQKYFVKGLTVGSVKG